ncbi:hypothetical protein SUFG_00032 [Sulfitobacter phage phiCB2047-B]|uniref:Uncharacterized protein n=1 Tax=Sulfitobacter phage phiCB2047-B TaxID=754046 RepID=M4PQM4_9CAUD|nr:hypothetical protein SUFG_00032 [Sulfitobacter phage phiCB2047-B]AGH07400.1 hypothetical protein SUFG_00032 [Sulfitobacter phage phiCB2047-B]
MKKIKIMLVKSMLKALGYPPIIAQIIEDMMNSKETSFRLIPIQSISLSVQFEENGPSNTFHFLSKLEHNAFVKGMEAIVMGDPHKNMALLNQEQFNEYLMQECKDDPKKVN